MNLFQQLRAGPPFDSQIWWIDEKGVEHLNEPLNPSNEDKFLRHLGLAKLELLPSLVEITWDTGLVHKASMVALAELFMRLNLDVTIRLSFYYHGWVHEIHKSSFWAMERIEEIQECKSVVPLHKTQFVTCPISDVSYASSRLKRGFQNWKEIGGRFEKMDQSDIAKNLPYAIIYCPDKREKKIVYSWVGHFSTAAKIYGPEWTSESIGKVTNRSFGQESQHLADKVSIGIAETLMTGEPLYQHFVSLMQIDGQEPFWLTYERLLTRHVLRSGAPIVISEVYPTQYIDIPLVSSP